MSVGEGGYRVMSMGVSKWDGGRERERVVFRIVEYVWGCI